MKLSLSLPFRHTKAKISKIYIDNNQSELKIKLIFFIIIKMATVKHLLIFHKILHVEPKKKEKNK